MRWNKNMLKTSVVFSCFTSSKAVLYFIFITHTYLTISLNAQTSSIELLFPNCDTIEIYNFDINRVLGGEINKQKDTIESLYCFAKQLNNPKVEIYSLFYLSDLYYMHGDVTAFKKYIVFLNRAILLGEKNNLTRDLLSAKERLCTNFTNNRMYTEAIIHAQEFTGFSHKKSVNE